MANSERSRTRAPRPASDLRVRVKLQTDVEHHEAEGEIPAGRWAYCKRMRLKNGAWEVYGQQFRVWDPWDDEEEGYDLSTDDEAKAEYFRSGANRYEFYDAPCKE